MLNCVKIIWKVIREAIKICLIQHFEADFLWKVSLKVLNSGLILNTFTHASPLEALSIWLISSAKYNTSGCLVSTTLAKKCSKVVFPSWAFVLLNCKRKQCANKQAITWHMGLDTRKPVFGGLQTTQVQTSLRNSPVWSAPLLFAF